MVEENAGSRVAQWMLLSAGVVALIGAGSCALSLQTDNLEQAILGAVLVVGAFALAIVAGIVALVSRR